MAKWFDLSRYGLSAWLDKADQPSFMRIQTIMPDLSVSDCIDVERLQSAFARAGVRSEVSELGVVTALDISLVNGVPNSRWWAETFPDMVLREMSDMAVSPILEAPQVEARRAQFFWEVVSGLDKEVHPSLSRVFFDRRGAEQFSLENKGQVFALKDEVFSLEWIADLRDNGTGSYVMPADAFAALSVDEQARILSATAPVPPAEVSDPLAVVTAADISDSDDARLRDALVERSSVLQGAVLDLRALGTASDDVMWLQVNAANGQAADLAVMTGIDVPIVSQWLNQHSDQLPLDPASHTALGEWPKELNRFSFADDTKRMLTDLGMPFDWMIPIKHDHVHGNEGYSPWESILNLRTAARQAGVALVMDDDSEGIIHAVFPEAGADTGLSIDWGGDGKVKIYVNGIAVPNSFYTEDHESQRAFFAQAMEQVQSLAAGVDMWSAEASPNEEYDPVRAIEGVLMARAVVEDELEGVFEDRLNDPRWLLMNAARPLTGTETQEGPFLAGRYYALLDLEEDSVAVAIQMNHDLDARAVLPVTQAEMRQMALNTFGAKYKDRLHEFEPDVIEAQIDHWVSQMHDRSYSDYQALLTQARSDIAEQAAKALEAPADRFEGDMRGMAYAITDSQGKVAATGTVPTLISADEEFAHIEYYQQLTKSYAGQLWVAPMPNLTFPDGNDQPLIFGMTWEQLSARQQGEDAPKVQPDNAQIPEGAVMVFDSAAPARSEEVADEAYENPQEEMKADNVDPDSESPDAAETANEAAEQTEIAIWPVPQAPALSEYALLVEGARAISNQGYRGNPDVKLSKQGDGTQLATFKGFQLGVFEGRASKKAIMNAITDRNFDLQVAIYAHLFARMQNEVARPMGLQLEVRGIQDPAQLAQKVAQRWDLLPDVSLNNALKLNDNVTVNFDVRMRLDEISIRVGVREQNDDGLWRSRDASWLPAVQSYGDALRSIPEQMISLAERPDTDPEVARLLRAAAEAIAIEDDVTAVSEQSASNEADQHSLPLLRQFALSTREGELSVAVAAASLLKDTAFKKQQVDTLRVVLYAPESAEALRALAGDGGLSHDEMKSKLLALSGVEPAAAEAPETAETAEAGTNHDSVAGQSDDVRRDYGEFIPGARKHQYGHDWHMWSDRQSVNVERYMLGGRELTSSDSAAARKMARKVKLDQFWPEPTFDQLMQDGTSTAAALYKLMVRAQMPSDTNAIIAGNSRDGRYMSARQWLILGAAFAERTEAVKERLDQVRTNADVMNEFVDHTGKEGPFNDVRRNLLDDEIHRFTNYYEDLTSTERLVARMAEHRQAALSAPSVARLARDSRYVKTPSVTDFVEALRSRVNAVATAYPELSDEQRSIAVALQESLATLLVQHKDDDKRAYAQYRDSRAYSFDDYKERGAELDAVLITSALESLDQHFAEAPLLGRLLLSPDMYLEDVVRVLESSDPGSEAAAKIAMSEQSEESQSDTAGDREPGTEAFKKWFGNSQIVDEEGEPLKVYHGSNEVFSQFSERHKGTNTGWANTNLGFFFIADREQAEQFAQEAGGDVVVEAYLSIKKPLKLVTQDIFNDASQAATIYEIVNGQRLSGEDALAALNEDVGIGELPDVMEALVTDDAKAIMIRDGYDGVISEFGGGHLEYVAFSASQIRIVPANQPEATIPPEESAILQVASRKKPAPRFKNLRRIGELVRDGDVTEEMVKDTFGLRGIQYGNSLPDKERQAMLNMCYDTFADLSNALAVPTEFIGFNGRLAMAFAARGQGPASAHFEPKHNVINLTRTMGAGALFHEYSHALDYFLKQHVSAQTAPQHMFQIGTGVYLSNGLDRAVMDNRQAPDLKPKGETPLIHPVMYNLIRDLVDGKSGAANNELMKQRVASDAIERTLVGPLMSKKVLEFVVRKYAIRQSEAQAKSEYPDDVTARMARAEALFPECEREGYRIANNWRKTLTPYTDDLARRAALSSKGEVSDDFMSALFENRGRRWAFSGGEYVCEKMNAIFSEKNIALTDSEKAFAAIWAEQIEYSRHARKVYKAILNDVVGFDGKQSNFMRDAITLDGSSKKLYWSNTQELWARGFSAILHDRLNKQGVVNDFASRYSAPKLFSGEGFIASSNPEGEERDWFYLRAAPFFSALQKVAHEVCPGSEISKHVVSDEDVCAFVQDALKQIEGSIQRFIDGNVSFSEAANTHSKAAIHNFIELYADVLPGVKPLVAEWATHLAYPAMSEDEGLSSVDEDMRLSRYEQRKETFNHWVQREVYPALVDSGVLSADAIVQQLRDSGNESLLLEYWHQNHVPELLPDVVTIFESRLDEVRHRLSVPIAEGDRQAELALKNAAHKAQSLGCNLIDRLHGSDMGEEHIQNIIVGIMDATIDGGASPWQVIKTFDKVKAWRIPGQQIERLAESILTDDYDDCQFDEARSFVNWLAETRGWEGHNVTPDVACRYIVGHPHGQHPSQAMQLALLPGTDTDALIMHAVDALDTALDVDTVEHLYGRLEQHSLQIKESTLDFVVSKLDPVVQERVKKQGEAYLVAEDSDALRAAGSAPAEMRM
jgi:hypothetical protein